MLYTELKTFVIHVQKFTERKEHIDRLLRQHNMEGIYILKGDIETLSPEEIDRFFAKDSIMYHTAPHVSCAIKHFYVCEYMVDNNLPGALVLEDDIVLLKNFDSIYVQSICEYEAEYKDQPVIINYENTRLRFVPYSKRIKGQVLYSGDRDRMTGCFFINLQAAKLILEKAMHDKCAVPIDHFHCELLRAGELTYLWCQPAIAEQGSFNGLFLSQKDYNSFLTIKSRWRCKLAYKKLLYWLR